MKSNATSPRTDTNLLSRAKLLPMPQPGIPINVPLALLPTYLQLHGMDPKQYISHKGILLIEKKKEAP